MTANEIQVKTKQAINTKVQLKQNICIITLHSKRLIKHNSARTQTFQFSIEQCTCIFPTHNRCI